MPAKDSPPVIFLSHSSEDKESAALLVRVLEAGLGLHENGQIVFTGSVARGLPGSVPVADQLIKHLRDCAKVIVVLSDSATAAPWVQMEAGAGFFQGKLVPVVVRSSHRQRVEGPVKQLNVLALDSAPEINRLIDQLRKEIPSASPEANQYQEEIDALVRHVESTYRGGQTGRWIERFRRSSVFSKALLFAILALVFLLALRGFLLPTKFTGKVVADADSHEAPNVGVFVNDQSRVDTNQDGEWHFDAWWLPWNHRFEVRTAEGKRLDGSWPGPTWRQRFGLSPAVVQVRMRTTDLRIVWIAPVVPSVTVYAASAPAQRQQRPPISISRPLPPAYEFGFWLQSVTVGGVPGLLRKSKLAYFKVLVGDELVDEDALRTAPLTLKEARSRFPVQVNPSSWLPVDDYATLPYSIFGRLKKEANDLNLSMRADGQVDLRDFVRMQMVGDSGDVLSEFDLTQALKGPPNGSQVKGSTPGYLLWIRPGLRVAPSAVFKLEWTPQRATIPAGVTASFGVKLTRGYMPFDVEVAIDACVPSTFVSFPCQPLRDIAQMPPRIVIPKGSSASQIFRVKLGPKTGRVLFVSKIPDALGGSVDVADIGVSGQVQP